MATAEDRMKILAMVQAGKINAEKGAQLLEAMENGREPSKVRLIPVPGAPTEPVPFGRSSSRWFRIQVTDTNTGKSRVNLRLPVNLVSAGAKMGARFAPQVQGLDSETLLAYINSGETGKIVDVYNEEDSEHVEVFIE